MKYKLNSEQILQGLRGNDSPYKTDQDNIRDAIELIKSQEQRIKKLTEENESLRAENAKYEAENNAQFDKWLKLEEATKRHHSELFEEAKVAVKEETVHKMQERLKYSLCCIPQCHFTYAEVEFHIDRIAKEMKD